MSLIAELKRRNVIRMAGLYFVAAWLLVQVASTVLPAFEAPAWAVRTLIVALAIGFVPALIFAWIFELTPEGLKRDADVPMNASIAPQTARRMDRMLLFVSVLAIAYFAFDKFVLAPHREAALVQQATEQVKAVETAEKSKVNPNSIAVLPFVNMSDDKDNQYFSDGISEEILNVLARISGLQVAARTSSFSFRDTKKEAPEISQELNVRMLLEGSVRKQGDRVRITAQLIDADKGYHVWSQTYDRELKDIFSIQDEIANAIAAELKIKIANVDGVPAASRGTRNVEAHDQYLRGLALWQTRGEDDLFKALAAFERSATIDPTFAEAYAGLALVYMILPEWSARITYADGLAHARDNAERAIALDPLLPEPYAVIGYLADGDRRRETAEALYRRSIALRPSFATGHQWLGNSLWGSGDLDGGLAEMERASVLDPQSPIIANNRAMALIAAGRFDDADAACRPLLASDSGSAICLEPLAFAAALRGDWDKARTLFDQYAAATNPSARDEVHDLIDALQNRGDRHAMAVRLAAFDRQSAFTTGSGNVIQPYLVVSFLDALGEPRLAVDYLRSFAKNDKAGQAEWAIVLLQPTALHCDPDFVALVEEIKATDPHRDASCAKKS
jgi:TolB-like protein/Flp pilus assembly protein TadD